MIVRSDTKVTKAVLLASAAPAGKLKVVGRAGAGVDNIDIPSATENNVLVLKWVEEILRINIFFFILFPFPPFSTPGGNSISACELTCSLIANLARPVAQAAQSMKEGRWDRKIYSGNELSGKTLAILGLGRIGREVGLRMTAFGMRCIGFDPITTKEEAHRAGVEKMELEEIWPSADYITVHTPLIPATKSEELGNHPTSWFNHALHSLPDLISEESLSKCKKGVKVVNVARGGIVDEVGLLKSLESGQCGGAGLDVFSEEPPKSDFLKNLIQHPKVVATPHLGEIRVEVEFVSWMVM